MLDICKKRDICLDYQDMQEMYKDIESIDDIPMFSGDHWAASIVKKMTDAQKKKEEEEKAKAAAAGPSHKKKDKSAAAAPPPAADAAAAVEGATGDRALD